MREEKEIREALKRLKDEHLTIMRQPDRTSAPILSGSVCWRVAPTLFFLTP